MRFLTFDEVIPTFRGKSVAVVGSAPSCAQDAPRRLVDSHDVVVRVNNFKNGPNQGYRTDVFYSFFGTSIRKSAEELQRDGVKLCMCKCPNSKPLSSEWHERNNKQIGIDYRPHYVRRAPWWFVDTFIPDDARYLKKFDLLEKHIPTTGFAAILDVLECQPSTLYLTGYDFFSSGMHNVDEPWKEKNTDDPICHRPDLEMAWLKANYRDHPIGLDRRLQELLA